MSYKFAFSFKGTSTMRRLFPIAIASLVLAACTSTGIDATRFPPVSSNKQQAAADRARTIASDHGLTVETLSVEAQVQRFGSGDEDRKDGGYIVWMTVAECPQGNFVVKTNVAAVPIQAYTRFGCAVDGVPSY